MKHYIDTAGVHYAFHKMSDDQLWDALYADSRVPPRHRHRRGEVFFAEIERRGWPRDPNNTMTFDECRRKIEDFRRTGEIPA